MTFPLRFRCWWLLLLLEVIIIQSLSAQTKPEEPTTPETIPSATNATTPPASPEVTFQNRLNAIPVSPYTGSPVINYPLYTFQEGMVSIPISLGYNATGLRAGEVASWCGLGWTLQAGGMITRQVRVAPDEGTAVDGQLRKGFFQIGTSGSDMDDSEPDLFVANLNGQIVRFQLDNNHQFQSLPDADIDIVATWKRSEADSRVLWIQGWKITTADGMKYYFGGFDGGVVDSWEYAIVKDAQEGAPGSDADSKKRITPTAWYLRRIESPFGQTVDLTYYRVYYAYPQLHDCEVTGEQNSNFLPDQKVDRVYVSALLLRSIEGRTIKVSFNKTYYNDCTATDPETGDTYTIPCPTNSGDVVRDDLINWHNTLGAVSKILKEIIVDDNTGSGRQLRYTFNYDYFRGSINDQRNLLPTNYNTSQVGTRYVNRLKLTGFTLPDGTTANFNYLNETSPFPGLLVRGVDHWGYFNGVDGAKHLIGLADCQGVSNWEANRSSSAGWGQYGTLNKISFSNGQETEFAYEGHQAWNYSGEIGGLRIQRITTKDVISNQYTIREYDYYNPIQNRSSGFLSLRPVYRFSSFNLASDSRSFYNSYLYPSALSRSGKPVVGYNYVKETQYSGPLDYNQFLYNAPYKENFRTGYAISWFNQDETNLDVCNYTITNSDFSHQPWKYHPDLDFQAGSLKRQQSLGRDGQSLSETTYDYETVISDRERNTFSARNIVIYNGIIGVEGYSKYFFKYRLKQLVTKSFDQDGNNLVENKVEYVYKDQMEQSYKSQYPGKHNQVVKTTTWNAYNQATDTYMRYAVDYDFGSSTITVQDICYDYDQYGNPQPYVCGEHQEERPNYQPSTPDASAIWTLKQKGMLANMIETHTQKNGQTLSAAYSRYKTGSGLLDMTYTLDEFPLTNFSSAQYYRNNGDQIIKDSRYKARIEYETYNSIGLPTSIKASNGARSQTNYGYSDLLPISVTQNAGVAGSLTTNYEHSPLFGVTRTIAPNGMEVRNIYESTTGRLLEVRDRDNIILKTYDYRRKDQ